MTFQTQFQAIETDQCPRLCPTVSKAREPLIKWDSPIDNISAPFFTGDTRVD